MLFFLFDIKHIWYRIWNSQSVVGGVCFVSHSWGAHELIKMWQFKCETRSVSRITFFPRGEKNIENRNRITKEKKIYFYAYFVVCHLKLKLNHAEKKTDFAAWNPTNSVWKDRSTLSISTRYCTNLIDLLVLVIFCSPTKTKK